MRGDCIACSPHPLQLHTDREQESWNALFTVPKQKACGSAALSKRLAMQEQRRAACRLESPVAADLLGDGVLLGPAALRTATQQWCDIAECEMHLATDLFSWLRRAGTKVLWLVELQAQLTKVAAHAACCALVSTRVVCFRVHDGSRPRMKLQSCCSAAAVGRRQGCLTILLTAGKSPSVPESDYLLAAHNRKFTVIRKSNVVQHVCCFSFDVVSEAQNC